jgi:fermentation-respiration switch protein FrsA (DUF1100 family)
VKGLKVAGGRPILRAIVRYVALIATGYVLLALLLVWREPSLIYFPMRQLEWTPQRVGLSYEDVYLTTADGVRIHGWHLPAAEPDRPDSLAVLFLHGNAGNVSHRLDKLLIFRDLGVSVLIIDYRGYGRSEGRPNERGTYADADAAYAHLVSERGVAPQRIVVYGESLGAAVAVDLASRVEVGGVVMESAFTSVVEVGQGMFPFLPVRWLVRNRYDSLSKIGRVRAPLLILHSVNDEFFPMRHPRRLLDAANEPKRLVELRGGHNDAFLVSEAIYRSALAEFFESLTGLSDAQTAARD